MGDKQGNFTVAEDLREKGVSLIKDALEEQRGRGNFDVLHIGTTDREIAEAIYDAKPLEGEERVDAVSRILEDFAERGKIASFHGTERSLAESILSHRRKIRPVTTPSL